MLSRMAQTASTRRISFTACCDAANQAASIAPLVLVRVVTGLVLFCWAGKYLSDGAYETIFVLPLFLCKYAGFEWVQVLPGEGMWWFFRSVQVASLLLAVGFLTRISAGLLAASVAYVLLVERCIYVNHYYLLACVCGWLALLPAGRCLAVDTFIWPRRSSQVFPRWQLWLLRFQLGMPYLFGAIAKLNSDWLSGQPPGLMLVGRTELGDFAPMLETSLAVNVLVYGGIFYDALIVPLLMWRRTRAIAIIASLGFHLTNASLLSIGVFPWFMLATLVVFFDDEWIGRVVGRVKRIVQIQSTPRSDFSSNVVGSSPWLRRFAVMYVVVQLVLPWRHWLLPGNPSWNERGHRFAWRMMLRNKRSLVHYKLVDRQTGEYLYLPSTTVLTGFQEPRAARSPECLRQAAVELSRLAKDFGVGDCQVYVLALVSMNGREPRPLIDPTVDLLTVRRGWLSDDWVTDSPGPFRDPAWQVDPEQWWSDVELPSNFADLRGKTPTQLLEFLRSISPQKVIDQRDPWADVLRN